jgi:signal transduction histidine kinase
MGGLSKTFLSQAFKRFLLPILSVFLALQINWLIAPQIHTLPPFLAFIAAIMISAWYGGFRPAVLGTVLSVLVIIYYFIDPIYSFSFNLPELGPLALFFLEAIGIAYGVDHLRKNDDRLRRANTELEQRVTAGQQLSTEKEERLRHLLSALVVTEERERQNLASELHDYLAQLLTLARMKIKQAQQSLSRSTVESDRFIRETDDLLHKSLGYVRTLMAELYPPHLHKLGLPAALRWLAEQMPNHGLTVDLSIECDSLSLPDDQAILLYQSVRELLMNVVKHAAVNRAAVILKVDPHHLGVVVQDSGRGFHASILTQPTTGKHFGLSSISERMQTIGGSFTVESGLGQGTTITLTLPLQPSFESVSLRAASAFRQDPIKRKPTVPSEQETLPLG